MKQFWRETRHEGSKGQNTTKRNIKTLGQMSYREEFEMKIIHKFMTSRYS